MNEIKMSSGKYNSLQEAINDCPEQSVISLDGKVYDETVYISKSIKLIGTEETVLLFKDKQLIIEKEADVTFERIMFAIEPSKHDANVVLKNCNMTFLNGEIAVKKQVKDTYSAVWAENSNVTIIKSNIKSDANLIKSIHGDILALDENNIVFDQCVIGIEVLGLSMTKITNNQISSGSNFLRISKAGDFLIERNKFVNPKEPHLAKPRFILIESIDQGELAQISDNIFHTEKTLNILIQNSSLVTRSIEFTGNTVTTDSLTKIAVKFDKIQGLVSIDKNTLGSGKFITNKCGEIILKLSTFNRYAAAQNKQIRVLSNENVQQVVIDGAFHVHLKNNKIKNEVKDEEAIKISSVDKVRIDSNNITSVDNGISIFNAGDNLETLLYNNEFSNCRKRAINLTSTTQRKFLKTELVIKNNVFMNNERAVFMDDQNMKHCTVEENYFGGNKDAIILLGGKATGDLKITGNFLTNARQKVEVRNAELCHLTHNNLNNSKIHLRGCEEILFHGNYFNNQNHKKGKCLDNDVCIKLGGRLTVTHNTMLKGKLKNENKEVYDLLNITAYERQPAITIQDNTQLEGYERRSFFDNYQPKALKLYPDESLLSMIQYEGDADHNMSMMDMDEVMRKDFYDLRASLSDLKEQIQSQLIRKTIASIVDQLDIEILAGRDSNDIYRFIVKTTETVEMLKIYITMEDTVDSMTEKRIVQVLNNYMSVLSSFLNKVSEDEQDKLKAQLNLLENLL